MGEPNLFKMLAGIIGVLFTTNRPRPRGSATFDHSGLGPVLDLLATSGLAGMAVSRGHLADYRESVAGVDPDEMGRDDALAFWINVYNACAIELAIDAHENGVETVLRVPGAFSDPRLEIAGERLSLDAIEHGKVRRFKDPRIHAALVCGSLSCPTLRRTPYSGNGLDGELDEQMRSFLDRGGAIAGPGSGELSLSRIFLWFGADFVRPGRMPTFIPAPRQQIRKAVSPWIPGDLSDREEIVFQRYDWGLACTVA